MTNSKHYSQGRKTESISSKNKNKTRLPTLFTIIQHSFGSPSHSNQRRKRNKRNPDWTRSKTLTVCRWHDTIHQIRSDQISRSVVSESQHTRPPCPSPSPGVHSDSCPLSQWCHRAISSSVVPWSSWPQSLPASELFPVSLLFAWGGQSIGSFKCLLGLILVNNLRVPSIESMTASSLPAEDSFFIWHVWKGWLIGT